MIVLDVLGYFNRNKQNSYAALRQTFHSQLQWFDQLYFTLLYLESGARMESDRNKRGCGVETPLNVIQGVPPRVQI